MKARTKLADVVAITLTAVVAVAGTAGATTRPPLLPGSVSQADLPPLIAYAPVGAPAQGGTTYLGVSADGNIELAAGGDTGCYQLLGPHASCKPIYTGNVYWPYGYGGAASCGQTPGLGKMPKNALCYNLLEGWEEGIHDHVPGTVTGIAPTVDARGYWLFTTKGAVAFGDARDYSCDWPLKYVIGAEQTWQSWKTPQNKLEKTVLTACIIHMDQNQTGQSETITPYPQPGPVNWQGVRVK